MEIGLSSASFYPNVKTEDSIALMKKLGFQTGELFLNSPSEYEEDFAKILLEQKNKHDFHIHSVHGFASSFEPFLFDSYKRRRDDMYLYFKKICKAAKILGADCYTFHGMRNRDLNTIDKKFIIEIYNKLIYTAHEEGIKLAQENVSWCASSNIDFLKMLVENCQYTINFALDIKQAYRVGIYPEDYMDFMGSNIVNLHINDRDKDNICLLPGKGEVDYKKTFCKLKEIGYNKIGIIEVYSDNYLEYNELSVARELLTNYMVK